MSPGSDERGRGFLARLLRYDDPDYAVRRVRRNALLVMAVLAVATALLTGSPWKVVGLVASGLLMLLNFNGMVAASDTLLESSATSPSPLQMAFLAGRHVLLGIVLCAIVLLPGVGVIPVALGLSVLVLAILLEAILQVSAGARRRP